MMAKLAGSLIGIKNKCNTLQKPISLSKTKTSKLMKTYLVSVLDAPLNILQVKRLYHHLYRDFIPKKTYLWSILTMAKLAGLLIGVKDTGELQSPWYNPSSYEYHEY